MAGRVRNAWFVLAGLMVLALPLGAQIQLGDNLNLNANGNVSVGYSDIWGNDIDSSHGVNWGGNGTLAGYYYNPNFINFTVNPYFNQNSSNSTIQSISNASGVSLSSNIFGGSHFPGSVNYTTAYNSQGNFGIPGVANYTTTGNSQDFGINWSALFPDYPTLSVGYQMGTSNYSLYGTSDTGSTNFRSFFMNSNYSIAGFGLGASFSKGSSNAVIPGIFVDQTEATSNSDSTNYNLTVSHPLPWAGNVSASLSRSDLNSDYLGYKFNGNIDTINVNAGVSPTNKLHMSLSGGYDDNLSGSIYEALFPTAGSGNSTTTTSGSGNVTTGGILDATQSSESSHAWQMLFVTSYAFAPNFQVQGQVERREQLFEGQDYGDTQYGGGLYYTRPLAGGYFGASGNVFDSVLDNTGSNALGFNANVNYNRDFGPWRVGGYFSYGQNVQTLLISYTNSFYNFSGNVSRKFGRYFWNATASAGRTGITSLPGTNANGESFSSSFGTSRLNLTGTYSKSDGNALATGSGLNNTLLPPIIPSNLLVLYGGTSYSFAFSGSPVRRMSASAVYVKANSNITNQGVASWNQLEEENFFLQYQFRQIGLTTGYSRLVQGFSASSAAPAKVSSVYIGLYRWFNFF